MFDVPRTDIPGHGRLAHAPKDHPRVPPARVGVLLANLGTPDGTDYWSMRRYLNEFLSDRRVIEWPVAIWQPILQGIVLTKRPFSSGEAYRGIWNEALDESPLLTITRSQTAKLRARLEARFGSGVLVDFCMRYGNPSTDAAIRRLKEQGAERIVFMPLYPQYAAPTTATANDHAFRTLMRMRWQPAVRTVPSYHDHPAYIAALAASVERACAGLEARPEALVASYHGLPQSYFERGDPYHCHCQKTTRLLTERLGWEPEAIHTTFQSRFGPEEWLQPYTVEHVAVLARQGKKHIAVMAPGFASDCVETLEEIQEEIRDAFLEAGGERFDYIPCLNDDDAHIDMLEEIVLTEGAGWLGVAATSPIETGVPEDPSVSMRGNMTVLEQVQGLIMQWAPEALCDDCIADKLGLSVRQHANHKTRELADLPSFDRRVDRCAACGRDKKVIRYANVS